MNLSVRLASCAWSRFSHACRLGVTGKSNLTRYATPLANRSSLLARNYATSEPDTGYKFSESHEWVSVADDVATIGITNYAQDKLGDVVYAELPEVGLELAVEDAFGVLESVKAASDLYSPLNGKVVEVNSKLADEPELINSDPYSAGWLIKLKMKDTSEYDGLMSHKDYMKLITDSS